MNEPSETAALRRGIRLDLVIAVCALPISTLATGAAWWQSRVVQQQLSAQVWPYVSIDTTTGNDSIRIGLIDYGLGPGPRVSRSAGPRRRRGAAAWAECR